MPTTVGSAPHRWFEAANQNEIRDGLRGVFRIHHEGTSWLFATDGCTLIAEISDASGETFPGTEDGARHVIFDSGIPAGSLSAAHLRDWAGEPEEDRREVCQPCGGEGERPHSCGCSLCDADGEECRACNGSGYQGRKPESRPGWVGPTLFDRNKVAIALAATDAEEFQIEVAPQGSGHRLLLISPRVRLVIMGILYGTDPEGEYPRLEQGGA